MHSEVLHRNDGGRGTRRRASAAPQASHDAPRGGSDRTRTHPTPHTRASYLTDPYGHLQPSLPKPTFLPTLFSFWNPIRHHARCWLPWKIPTLSPQSIFITFTLSPTTTFSIPFAPGDAAGTETPLLGRLLSASYAVAAVVEAESSQWDPDASKAAAEGLMRRYGVAS